MRLAANILVAAALLVPPSIASAEDVSPATTTAKKAPDPNQVVCEKQSLPGSRLATARVCHTRAEWADLRHQDRQDLEKVQVNQGLRDDH